MSELYLPGGVEVGGDPGPAPPVIKYSWSEFQKEEIFSQLKDFRIPNFLTGVIRENLI